MKKLLWIPLLCSLFILTACDRNDDTKAGDDNAQPLTEKVKSAIDAGSEQAQEAAQAVTKAASDKAEAAMETAKEAENVAKEKVEQANQETNQANESPANTDN